MDRHLRAWQPEDEPAVARVDTGQPDHVLEELAVFLGLFAVADDVRSVDHGISLFVRVEPGQPLGDDSQPLAIRSVDTGWPNLRCSSSPARSSTPTAAAIASTTSVSGRESLATPSR